MKVLKEYLLRPETIWKIVVGIFALGIVRSNLNNADKDNEQRINKLESLDLESRLTKIEVDVSWVRNNMEESHK